MRRGGRLAYIDSTEYESPARLRFGGFLADWYVYQHDGDPLGPWATDLVADAILTGKLAPDVWVAAPGGPRWLRALDVPVIAGLVEGLPTKPRRESGLRLMPAAYSGDGPAPSFGTTMMMVNDDELEWSKMEEGAPSTPVTKRNPLPSADETLQVQVPAGALENAMKGYAIEPAPPTDRWLPPSSSSTPDPPTVARLDSDAAESPSTDRRRRKKA